MIRFLEGWLATLERGGGAVEGFGGEPSSEAEITPRVRGGVRTGRTAYVGRVLGFFESFPFFQLGRRLWAFVGPVAQYAFVLRRS